MNIKKLEKKIQEIIEDDNFKIKEGRAYWATVNELESLICKIAKLNDAIGDVEYIKDYYSDIFNSRKKYLSYILSCEDLSYLMEKRRKELIAQFQDFIEEICNNDDLFDLFEEDFPDLKKILYEIKNDEDCIIGIIETISYLEQWLDIISYEELDDDILELLNDEFKDFYEIIFDKKGASSHERTRGN